MNRPPLAPETLLDLFGRMTRIRLVEERLGEVQAEGELPGPVRRRGEREYASLAYQTTGRLAGQQSDRPTELDGVTFPDSAAR